MRKPRRPGPADVRTPTAQERDVVDEGRVRCGVVRAWPQVLDQLGAETDALFAEAGIARSLFDDPDNTLTYSVGGRLLKRSVEFTGARHLGILIGQPVTLSALGAVGFLMRASPTVGHALHLLGEHFHLHDRGGHVSVEVQDSVAILCYRITARNVEAADQIYMIAAAAACNFIRELRGPGWRPLQVELPFRRPASVAPLSKVLAAPLMFDADRMGVAFPAADLARPVTNADPVLYGMMSERVAALQSRFDQDLPGRVRGLLQTLVFLPDGRGSIVAQRLGMSLRTLSRRLASHGVTLQAIRDEVLCEAACQLLQFTEKPAHEIAIILGYADASAFTRAFNRWLGMPPAQWRARKAAAPRSRSARSRYGSRR